MRNIVCNVLLIVGLMTVTGLFSNVSAFNGKDDVKVKRPKNTGTLSIKTTPESYPVIVDGKQIGMSGVETPMEFYLSPGMHRLEVQGPDGKTFVKDIEIIKDASNCVCLKIVKNEISRPCPYNVSLSAPESVGEGDLVTFSTINAATDSPNPLKYVWTVSPSNARITSGLGTSSITVDTTGLDGQTVTAEVDVSDGFDDAVCRQRVAASSAVKAVVIEKPEPEKIDAFDSVAFDDDKARLDNFVIRLQNQPDAQAYIIMYQGTDKASVKLRDVEKLSKRTLDYLVKTRGVDPGRIYIVKGGTRTKTSYELWVVPPGAPTPVPQ